MSEPQPDELGFVLPENMSYIVELADAELPNDFATRRPQGALDSLKQAFDVDPTDRFAYRPQPVPAQVPGFEYLQGAPDVSLSFLGRDGTLITNSSAKAFLNTLARDTHDSKTHVLSHLDAASHLTPISGSTTSAAVSFVEGLVSLVLKYKHELWLGSPVQRPFQREQIPNMVCNCMTYAFIQRLMFYDARLKGNTLAVYRRDLAQLRKDMCVPDDFDLVHMLIELRAYIDQELERINDLWEANVQLEWVGEPIPVEDISTLIEDDDEATCIVCRYSLTPPGVITACGHIYCKECLQSWSQACEPASHQCAYCRTQLFAKPDYAPKEPEVAMNYAHEREGQEKLVGYIRLTHKSCEWFEAELTLQQIFENETAKPST